MTKLSQSSEDYIEAILMIACENAGKGLAGIIETDADALFATEGGKDNVQVGPVRSIDIANKLGVSKPSVSRAVLLLKERGLITQQPYGDIYLTNAGVRYAKEILSRHNTLTHFFADIVGVPQPTAEEEACKIEHAICPDTFQRWTEFISLCDKQNASKKK